VSLFPLLEYVPAGFNRDHLRATRLLRRSFEAEIASRRATGARSDDALSTLMDVALDDGTRPTDREVRDELVTMSVTGYDGLSDALAWVLYLLGQHPSADARVAAEVTEAPADGGESPHVRLPYTTSVVREALRLYPPTWLIVRIARGPDRLPSGAAIPPGAKVYVCSFVLHRSPRHWPEPERFDPDRFANGASDERPRYAYFPFGGGEHVCVAEMTALDHIATVLAAIVPRYRLTLPPATVVLPEGGLTLGPRGGLVMRAEPRGG
jgi:cytochrome P450